VNWRYQLRASLFAVVLALILLSLLNLNVYFTTKASTESILVVNPGLRASLEARDRHQAMELALGSLITTLAIFALGIFQSHKTAGAAFSLARTLNRLRDGCYDVKPRLRRDDNLQELLAPIDSLARALRATDAAEMEILQSVVDAIERSVPGPARSDLTAQLLGLIAGKRIRVSPPASAGRPPAA
jgi:hypothetical protein